MITFSKKLTKLNNENHKTLDPEPMLSMGMQTPSKANMEKYVLGTGLHAWKTGGL
jgi:hypothetical protein